MKQRSSPLWHKALCVLVVTSALFALGLQVFQSQIEAFAMPVSEHYPLWEEAAQAGLAQLPRTPQGTLPLSPKPDPSIAIRYYTEDAFRGFPALVVSLIYPFNNVGPYQMWASDSVKVKIPDDKARAWLYSSKISMSRSPRIIPMQLLYKDYLKTMFELSRKYKPEGKF